MNDLNLFPQKGTICTLAPTVPVVIHTDLFLGLFYSVSALPRGAWERVVLAKVEEWL